MWFYVITKNNYYFIENDILLCVVTFNSRPKVDWKLIPFAIQFKLFYLSIKFVLKKQQQQRRRRRQRQRQRQRQQEQQCLNGSY
jgi:hypothetical protein